MIVTNHTCRTRATCSNCNRGISPGEQMMSARDRNMVVNAHVRCPNPDGAVPARKLMLSLVKS